MKSPVKPIKKSQPKKKVQSKTRYIAEYGVMAKKNLLGKT